MTNYEKFKKLIPQQYKDTKNFNKILEIFSRPFDELDKVFADIKMLLNIDLAAGVQLDLIGDIIVEKRNGRNDDDYRIGIKFKIFKNTSRGLVSDVVKILKFLTNADLVVYSDNPPAAYTIYTNGQNLNDDIQKLMDKVSAAGVSVIVFASDGETPLIMNNIITNEANLVDNLNDNIVDDTSNQIIVNYRSIDTNNTLQKIFRGKGMGAVQNLSLTTNSGDSLITDTGDTIVVFTNNNGVVGGGKMNIVYQ